MFIRIDQEALDGLLYAVKTVHEPFSLDNWAQSLRMTLAEFPVRPGQDNGVHPQCPREGTCQTRVMI